MNSVDELSVKVLFVILVIAWLLHSILVKKYVPKKGKARRKFEYVFYSTTLGVVAFINLLIYKLPWWFAIVSFFVIQISALSYYLLLSFLKVFEYEKKQKDL